jgi:hypothetical protein
MEEEKKVQFLNGVDRTATDFVPDPGEQNSQRPVSDFFDLDEIATDDADTEIIADDPLRHVEVRKPHEQEWFQAHPTWQMSAYAVIKKVGYKESVHLLSKSLMPWPDDLENDIRPIFVQACVNITGRMFVWPIRKSQNDGEISKTFQTALEHVKTARTSWIRHFWNQKKWQHEMKVINDPAAKKPNWPDGVTFAEVMDRAFGSKIIKTLDHPVLQELRGEGLRD